MLRGRFIAIQVYLKKQEKSQINNLTLHLRQLEKEEMKNPRVSRRKEMLKIRAEINAKETKETIAKINKAKFWYYSIRVANIKRHGCSILYMLHGRCIPPSPVESLHVIWTQKERMLHIGVEE